MFETKFDVDILPDGTPDYPDELLKTFEHTKAIDLYTKALSASPNSAELLWRISRAYIEIGEHQPAGTDKEKEEQLKTYEKATEFAAKAIAGGRFSDAALRLGQLLMNESLDDPEAQDYFVVNNE